MAFFEVSTQNKKYLVAFQELTIKVDLILRAIAVPGVWFWFCTVFMNFVQACFFSIKIPVVLCTGDSLSNKGAAMHYIQKGFLASSKNFWPHCHLLACLVLEVRRKNCKNVSFFWQFLATSKDFWQHCDLDVWSRSETDMQG